MSESTLVFTCAKCKRMVAVPDQFRYAITCPYCDVEMKPVVTED